MSTKEVEVLLAIDSGNYDFVKKNCKNISYKDELNGQNLLAIALKATTWNSDIPKYLIKKKASLAAEPDNDRRSVWHIALKVGLDTPEPGSSLNRFAWLLTQKEASKTYDPLAQDLEGNSVLHLLVEATPKPGFKQQSEDLQKSLKELMKLGHSVHFRNYFGQTALHRAVRAGNVEAITFLLEQGAKLNVIDNAGNFPLHYSAHSGSPETVELLLEKKAYYHPCNEQDETPWTIAHNLKEKGKEVAEKLFDKLPALHNAVKNRRVSNISMFLSGGTKVDELDKQKLTALHHACALKSLEIAKFLVEKKATVNLQDHIGNTPLHYLGLNTLKASNSDLEGLLKTMTGKCKEVIDMPNNEGETPLYNACLIGNIQVTTALLQANASVNTKTKSGETPLHAAVFGNSPQAWKILEQAQIDKNIKASSIGTASDLATAIGDLNMLTQLGQAKKRRTTTLRATSETPRLTVSGIARNADSRGSLDSALKNSSPASSSSSSTRTQTVSTPKPTTPQMSATPISPIVEKSDKKEKKSASSDKSIKISGPTKVTRGLHVSTKFEWSGGDPEEMFDLQTKLGEGAYGSVFKAAHRQLNSFVVAIKMVPSGDKPEEIEREMKILEACKSATIVNYYGSVVKSDKIWILMEFCSCGSLDGLIKAVQRKGKLMDEQIVAALCAQIARSLLYLHTKTDKKPVIIHRDLKPGNVLLTDRGEAKLADFGVSAQLSNTLGKAQTTIGTPMYMAPEAIDSERYDLKVDIWALGIVCIELAQGALPFANMSVMRAINQIVNQPPPTLNEPQKFSQNVNKFIATCLVKDAAKRPATNKLISHEFLVSVMGQEQHHTMRAISEFTDYQLNPTAAQLFNSPSNSATSTNSEIIEKMSKTIKNLQDELEQQKAMATLPKDELVNKLSNDLKKERDARDKQAKEIETLKNEMRTLTLKLGTKKD